ncbi:hypothetical protein E2C01_034213 [Portunus trituberculatus]|uniref:Uncharacterized protein n=1 Tax=Portunus trituberculatus TaxID=210409 RepID=A0A5B7F6C9_PORTR|nr:hypothetical protein [Portunus trituberculatus]
MTCFHIHTTYYLVILYSIRNSWSARSADETPLDPETGLRSSDPAVPLIRAIKEELRRFKSSISTESSSA